LNRPRLRRFYEGEEVDLAALAATLLWGIVKNHAFYDGNKRTAWVVTQYFLYQNGYTLPYGSHSTRLVLSIALGRRSVDEVEGWIRKRLEPASQMTLFW
jgi:death on curing protein